MPPGQDHPRLPEPSAELGRLPTTSRWGLAAGALVLLLWGVLHALVDRPAVHDQVRSKAAALLASRLPGATLGPVVQIDWAFRVWVGPLRVPAANPDAPLVVEVDRIRVRASLPALLAGRAEPASIRLYGLRLRPGPGGRDLLDLLERIRAPRPRPNGGAPAGRGDDPVVYLRGATVLLPWRGGELVLGPYEGRLKRSSAGGQELIEGSIGLPGGGRLDGTLRRSGAPPEAASGPTRTAAPTRSWSVQLHLAALAADLPSPHARGDVKAETGALTMEAEASGDDTGGRGTLSGRLEGLFLHGARLGSEPVGPLAGSGEVEFTFLRRGKRLELRRGQARLLGPARFDFTGVASLEGDADFSLALKLAPVTYTELVDALPAALAPPTGSPRPPGAFGASLELTGRLGQLGSWRIGGDLDLAAMRAAARSAAPSPLLATFPARPGGEDGPPLLVGPENPEFVPLADLPPHVVRALTTSEDAGFFGHNGFDFPELLDALAASAQAGKVVRGGSTISQQLAKNLYLSRDRTLARKVREALLTVALEASVGKARLLEIYLNLIEWGPDLHGIGPAARRYFGVEARALTPRQACFLAAVVPAPRRGWALVEAGQGAEAMRERIDALLLKLNGYGVIDDETLLRELEAPLVFAFGAAPAGGTPPPVAGPDPSPDDVEDDAPPPAPATASGSAGEFADPGR